MRKCHQIQGSEKKERGKKSEKNCQKLRVREMASNETSEGDLKLPPPPSGTIDDSGPPPAVVTENIEHGHNQFRTMQLICI